MTATVTKLRDELPMVVARRIESIVRRSDKVARIGGDEFVVLFDTLNSIAVARNIAGKLVASLALPFSVLGGVRVHRRQPGRGLYALSARADRRAAAARGCRDVRGQEGRQVAVPGRLPGLIRRGGAGVCPGCNNSVHSTNSCAKVACHTPA